MIERFTFFKEWWYSGLGLLSTDQEKLKALELMCKLAFEDVDTPDDGTAAWKVFNMARPAIWRNIRFAEGGALGGSIGGRASGPCKARFGNQNAKKTQSPHCDKRKATFAKNAKPPTSISEVEVEGEVERERIPPPPTSSSQTPPGASDTPPQGSGGGVFGVGEIPSFDRVMQSLGPAALPVKDRLRVKYDQLVKDGWLDADRKPIRRWCLYFATVASKMLEGEE